MISRRHLFSLFAGAAVAPMIKAAAPVSPASPVIEIGPIPTHWKEVDIFIQGEPATVYRLEAAKEFRQAVARAAQVPVRYL